MNVRRKMMRSLKASIVGASFVAAPILGSAWAAPAPCVVDTVANYQALGATGCSVDGVTFSNINVSTLVFGGGVVTLGNFTPFSVVVNGSLESGLSLNYIANAGVPGSEADVRWQYNVSGNLLNDAFLSFAGNVTGNGQAQISEVLSNGKILSLNSYSISNSVFLLIAS